jgi:hypothetical protein
LCVALHRCRFGSWIAGGVNDRRARTSKNFAVHTPSNPSQRSPEGACAGSTTAAPKDDRRLSLPHPVVPWKHAATSTASFGHEDGRCGYNPAAAEPRILLGTSLSISSSVRACVNDGLVSSRTAIDTYCNQPIPPSRLLSPCVLTHLNTVILILLQSAVGTSAGV